jgi:hypothetical protein
VQANYFKFSTFSDERIPMATRVSHPSNNRSAEAFLKPFPTRAVSAVKSDSSNSITRTNRNSTKFYGGAFTYDIASCGMHVISAAESGPVDQQRREGISLETYRANTKQFPLCAGSNVSYHNGLRHNQ